MNTMGWLKIASIVVAIYLLHRLALWAESRGWIHYRHRRPSSSSLGNAFLEVQNLVDPAKRAVLEERRREVGEQDESGEPPPDP